MLLNCGAGQYSTHTPLDCKIKPVNPKGTQPWIFIGRTYAEVEAPILWTPDEKIKLTGKDPDAGKDWGQEEKGLTEDEMVGWHHWLNRHESEQTLEDSEGQGSLACCSPWGRIESNMTEQLSSRLPSQLMLTAINADSSPKKFIAYQGCPFYSSSQDHLLNQSPHTGKAMNLKFKSVNWHWLLSLGFNLTLILALWQSQDHTSLTIACLDFL